MNLLALASRRYRLPSEPFRVRTEDGVDIAGRRVGEAGPAVVFCHGFIGWHHKPTVVALAEDLAAWFRVYVPDLRGHGLSGGRCTYGDREYLDVDAVVRMARGATGGPVATLGASMGAIAVLRQAAFCRGVDAVVSVSAPARWDGHTSRAVARVRWATGTSVGRRAIGFLGVRVSQSWEWPEDPEDVVGKIAPIPLVIVHGRDDHFFDEEEAWRLYRRAGEPKRLLLASSFGHAEDGFTPAFAGRIARHILEVLPEHR